MSNDGEPTPTSPPSTFVSRLRSTSLSLADRAYNFNPQPGMWAATGTAIAYAPTLTELREPVAGGENIEFNEHGHSARTVTTDEDGSPILSTSLTRSKTRATVLEGAEVLQQGEDDKGEEKGQQRPRLERKQTLLEQSETKEKHTWIKTIGNGFSAFWKFFTTPTGFLMTIYGINIVAWGAMLFFLLLGACPAMNHPSKDSLQSPRKIWLEIDSQILNALFCVTGFGLAPWRFRDLWWLIRARVKRDRYAMGRLNEQNVAWFRPPTWYGESSNDLESAPEEVKKRVTFTGEEAPPTKIWKLSFVIWMMVLNTLFQCVLAAMMWGYNRFNRPTWSTGTFIGLGCGVSLAAGVMMWWEGRKVKRIEGPMVKVVESEVRKSHRPLR